MTLLGGHSPIPTGQNSSSCSNWLLLWQAQQQGQGEKGPWRFRSSTQTRSTRSGLTGINERVSKDCSDPNVWAKNENFPVPEGLCSFHKIHLRQRFSAVATKVFYEGHPDQQPSCADGETEAQSGKLSLSRPPGKNKYISAGKWIQYSRVLAPHTIHRASLPLSTDCFISATKVLAWKHHFG